MQSKEPFIDFLKEKRIRLEKEMLVFDLDTLRISEKQLSPNFELAVKEASPDVFYLVEESRYLNNQISFRIKEAIGLGQMLFGPEWEIVRARIKNVQAIPRL